MKNRYWIALLSVVLLVSMGLSLWVLWPGEAAVVAEVYSDGKLVRTVPLTVDQVFVVETDYGTNTVTVENGKIAVTAASCPDHYCMHRGFCDSGTAIVCLPNKLVIEFVGHLEIDGVVG